MSASRLIMSARHAARSHACWRTARGQFALIRVGHRQFRASSQRYPVTETTLCHATSLCGCPRRRWVFSFSRVGLCPGDDGDLYLRNVSHAALCPHSGRWGTQTRTWYVVVERRLDARHEVSEVHAAVNLAIECFDDRVLEGIRQAHEVEAIFHGPPVASFPGGGEAAVASLCSRRFSRFGGAERDPNKRPCRSSLAERGGTPRQACGIIKTMHRAFTGRGQDGGIVDYVMGTATGADTAEDHIRILQNGNHLLQEPHAYVALPVVAHHDCSGDLSSGV
jgi:hypothetical protein